MAKRCAKCGGEMEEVHSSDAHNSRHGGLHTAQHGLKGGHPIMVGIGLIATAISFFMKSWKCRSCGHVES